MGLDGKGYQQATHGAGLQALCASVTTGGPGPGVSALVPKRDHDARLELVIDYQSSFTANTASLPAAARAASQAVTVPATTTARHSASSLSQGSIKSMVQ